MRKTYINYILFSLTVLTGNLCAQIPVIEKVEPLSTYPAGRILISGSGFNSNAAQLQVWFDHMKGNIVTSSDYAIEVDVPLQAKLSNIEVINLSSKLSAKSSLKFMPSFNGEAFDPTKFTTPLTFTSTQELWDLCSCDLNNDAKPDIISTKFFSPATDLMILQNQSTPGNLSFTKLDKTNLSVLDLTFPADNVVCGDLQGDGKPDLVVTRSGSPRNSIHILTNTSSGTISFAAPVNLILDVGHLATRSSIRDLNGDGKPEIITTNSFNNTIYIFQNESSGGTLSFNPTPVKIDVTGATNTYAVDIQDLDNDGLADIIVNQFQTNDIFLLKNNSAGAINFPTVQKISVTGTLNRITTADLNNDGLLDLISTNTVSNQVKILLNNSTSTSFSFPTSLSVSTSTGPWGVDVSDFDGDGDPDIIVANRNQQAVNVLLHSGNYSAPSFVKKDIATAKPSRNILAGDFDGDAKPDLAFTSFNTSTNAYSLDILRNKNCHQPKILNTGPLVICAGQTIRLNAIPAANVTFSWKESGSPVAGTNSYLDITTPGTYTVTATGESGACALTSASITVTSDPGAPPSDPSVSSNSPICNTSNLQLSTPAVSGATYTWTGPNNFTSSQQNPVISNVDIQDAGLYILQVSVGVCKSNFKSTRVDIVDLGELAISSTVASNKICQGNSLVLSVASDPNYTYKWIKNSSYIAGQTANTLTVTQAGNYQAEIKNTVVSCTRTTNTVAVTVLTPPVSSFQLKSTGCVNEQITFTNQSTVDPLATTIYNWNFGDSNNSTAASPTHSYITAQVFNPSLQVSYSGVTGCTNSSNKNITISNSSAITIVAASETICPDESTDLFVSGTYTSIVWSNGGSGLSTSVSATGTYSITAFDSNGCAVADEITIGAKTIPTILVTADKTTINAGTQVQLTASGADTYSWLPVETLSDASLANPIATPTATTTYTVTGTLTAGCSSSNQITITIDNSEISITIPPAFSPNGDGSNEQLIIQGASNYPECIISVYDGRGRKVYQAQGNGENWDGTYQGKPVPDGTYYYVFSCPEGKPLTGSILVFR
jgi:gliding motility-associated-like protein